jgi:hypothetical protein
VARSTLTKRFGAKNIRIIGSVARRQAHDASDIDLLAGFVPNISLLPHAAFPRDSTMLQWEREIYAEELWGVDEKIQATAQNVPVEYLHIRSGVIVTVTETVMDGRDCLD